MKTPKRRVEELEKITPKQTKHHYEKIIGWGETKIETKYFKDGEPITGAEYERDAPKEIGKIKIDWSEYVPPGEEHENTKQTG